MTMNGGVFRTCLQRVHSCLSSQPQNLGRTRYDGDSSHNLHSGRRNDRHASHGEYNEMATTATRKRSNAFGLATCRDINNIKPTAAVSVNQPNSGAAGATPVHCVSNTPGLVLDPIRCSPLTATTRTGPVHGRDKDDCPSAVLLSLDHR